MIAQTAIIHPNARLEPDIDIGHYTIIGDGVEVGSGTSIGSHVVIDGPTVIGSGNSISHHAVLGGPPQDLKYKNEPTRLEIGNGNVIREFVTLHRGTADGGGITRIGNKNLIMAYAHIAHDCQIGNDIIIANAVNMAGHVHISDFVSIGGMCAIHQFVHIGRYAFVGGFTAVSQDIIPFGMVAGDRGRLRGINTVGLKRRGFDLQRRRDLHSAVRFLISSEMNVSHALEKIKDELTQSSDIDELISFIEKSQRGICL